MNANLSSFLDGEEDDGSLKNRTTILAGMTLTTSFCHCILGFIGLGINGFISYAIATIEELRSQTRYVLFLGMLTGNILSYVNLFLEVVYFSLTPSKHNCQLLRALLGLPNVIFFANYLLALIDNYVAITRNDLHRAKFTVRNVVPCQIGFTVVVCAFAKFLFLIGAVPLDCSPSIPTRMFVLTTLVLLIVPCVVLKIAIFIKTQQEIIPHHPNSSSSSASSGGDSCNSIEDQEVLEGAAVGIQGPTVAAANDEEETMRVHATQAAIAKLEKEAMRALMFSVLSLLVIYIPRVLFNVSTFVCTKLVVVVDPNQTERRDEKCNFLEAWPIFTEYTALHGIIQPAAFLWFSDQFRTAWKNRHHN